MDPFKECPIVKTEHLTIRLIEQADSESLFQCYHDKEAVSFMNDDNCDFGFYVETPEKMEKTVGYWINFYHEGAFIRFTMVDNATNKAIGTIEGFCGDTGVLRVDIQSDYEKSVYLKEIFDYAAKNFKEYFHNEELVTKAVKEATERRSVLKELGWEYIGEFRNFGDYYRVVL